MKCHDCVLMRTCRANCKFCRLICAPDNFLYYIPDDWSGEYPYAAPMDKLIANYRKHNSEEETLAMLKRIRYSRNPSSEMIARAREVTNDLISLEKTRLPVTQSITGENQ